MSILAPFQLLELNVISAQDLEPVCSRKMRTYAVAWIHSEQKLSTRIDTQGHTNPKWNDKFYFRMDDEFLHDDTSTLTIEIYAVHWFRDIQVGTIRIIIDDLIQPISQRRNRQEIEQGLRLVSFQVWRPSGRSQGILNIGVALLDSSMRSMPLYRHLMGKQDIIQSFNNNQFLLNGLIIKPELRRTKSDSSSSSSLGLDSKPKRSIKGPSVVNGESLIVKSRRNSMVNYVFDESTERKRKTPPEKSPLIGSILIGSDYGASRNMGGQKTMTDSELGPSPSEVAAAVAKSKSRNKMEAEESWRDKEEWSLDGSIEGLQSKLERWRSEIPPVYDRSNEIYDKTTTTGTKRLRPRRKNKKGLCSCFGNICGCQVSLTCG